MISSSNADLIWAAAALSTQSSFVVAAAGGKSDRVVRMTLRSVGKEEMVKRVATSLGLNVSTGLSNGKNATTMTIQGDKLHEVMTQLWPYLTRERKEEYAKVRAALKEYNLARKAGAEAGTMTRAERKKMNKATWAKQQLKK